MAANFEFTIGFDDFDTSLLPPDARTPGTPEFIAAVSDLVSREYQRHGGWARVVVDERARLLNVAWGSGDHRPNPMETIIDQLHRGRYDEAIRSLEVLRFQEPYNAVILYNLGMALSNQGRLPAAISHLRRATELAPSDANAHVALGVAYARGGQTDAAVSSLREAVRIDPTNPWAHRNLGGCLLRIGKAADAEPVLRRAVELSPDDAAAHVGLGHVLFDLDRHSEADEHFLRAIDLDPHGRTGESAKERRTQIAQAAFRAKVPGGERPDAIMYLLGAMERFAALPLSEIQRIGFEIAMLGMKGIDTNDPAQKYTLKSIAGTFSGLHLMCLMYVAFKQIAPDRDIGFDVTREYESALNLINAQKGKSG